MECIERHRTALTRNALSRPVAVALDDGLISPTASIFDYGCGRGGDIQRLTAMGYEATGWDPVYQPEEERRPADVVNLGYVVNVIEDQSERAEALKRAWALTKRVLVVAARLDWDSQQSRGRRYSDGVLTERRTFQKYYTQEELRAWIDGTLGTRSIAATPGVFYVFRDESLAQTVLATRVRRRPATVARAAIDESAHEADREILGPLLAFIESRGRPPELFEIDELDAARAKDRFGSIRVAIGVARRSAGEETWSKARGAAHDDVRIYLALSTFAGRPKFSALPPDLQIDVKAFFGTYRAACAAADSLLFSLGDQATIEEACRSSSIGKRTPEALYVHTGAIDRLAPVLRVYEGCARALTGRVEEATLVKLNRIEPKVSYLSYPDFDSDPHPSLSFSVRAHLRQLDIKYRDFRESQNPPILHRKETFVPSDYPQREVFASLTEQEEQLGLLSSEVPIGTRNRWGELLNSKGLRLCGHNVVPM